MATTSNFIKFHGITMANNSWIENLYVERLTADPIPAQPGRIWMNTTTKRMKFSSLNDAGAVVVYDFAIPADFADTLQTAKDYTDQEVAALVASAPDLLNTLKELADAIQGDANFATTVATSIATKLSKSGDTMSGLLTLSGAPQDALHATTKLYVDGLIDEQMIYSTDDVPEGVLNSYYHTALVQADIGLTSDNTAVLSYANGQFTYNHPGSDDILEGQTNQYFTTARVRDSISVAGGSSGSTPTTVTYRTSMMEFTNFDYNTMGAAPKIVISNASMGLLAALQAGSIAVGSTLTVPSMMGGNTVFTVTGAWNSAEKDAWSADVTKVSGSNPMSVSSFSVSTGSSGSGSSLLSYSSSTGEFTFTTPDTDEIAEGTNQYFTTTRARASISGGNNISYDSATGIISSVATIESVNGQTGVVVLTTSHIDEGAQLYFTDGRAVNANADAVAAVQAAVDAEAIAARAAEATLTTDLAAEATRATAAEGVLTSAVTTETNRATAAEGVNAQAIADEVVRATAAEGVLTGAIAAEATTARAAEGVLSTDLAAEVTRATGAEATLTTNLSAEVIRATGAEAALGSRIDSALANIDPVAIDSISEVLAAFQTADGDILASISALSTTAASNLAAEVTRATAAEAGLASDLAMEASARGNNDAATVASIAAEVTRATAAEVAVAADLATEVTRATGAEATLTTAIATEATTARAAEGILTVAISNEVARATAAEGVLTTDLANEATARIAGDATAATDATTKANAAQAAAATDATTKVAAEETRAMLAEDGLAADITAEETRAMLAETGLDTRVTTVEGQVSGKIGDLTTLTTDAKTSLVAAINEVDANVNTEATARAAADTAIRSAYNATNFTFQSGIAATTHVVTHSLDADFVSFTVMIERDDGTYRNDIVSVAETSRNALTVYLSESAKIKMAVHSMSAL